MGQAVLRTSLGIPGSRPDQPRNPWLQTWPASHATPPHQISSNQSSMEHASLGGAGAEAKGWEYLLGAQCFSYILYNNPERPSTLLPHFTEGKTETQREVTCLSLPRDGEEAGIACPDQASSKPALLWELFPATEKRAAHQVSHLPVLLHFRMPQSFSKNSSNSGSSARRSWLPSMAKKTAAPTSA